MEQDGMAMDARPLGIRTKMAVQWLPVRTKALGLMGQKARLGNRISFAQNIMVASRISDQEDRSRGLGRQTAEILKCIRDGDWDRGTDDGC